MAGTHSRNGWMVWLTFAIGMLLSVSPMPQFMEILRPLWLALLLAFWALALPHKVGMVTAMCLGLAEDVMYGTLLGQNALILTLITLWCCRCSNACACSRCGNSAWSSW